MTSHLRSKGNDIAVFHILDPAELRFPFEAPSSFEDLETGEQVPVTPEVMHEEYLEMIGEHTRELTREMLRNEVDYALLDTSRPLDHALFHFLSHRERRIRGR
jgi:hypothetical protein